MRRALAAMVWLGVASVVAHGAPTDDAAAPLRTVNAEAYRAELGQLRDLARRCGADSKACNVSDVGDDLHVSPGGFDVHWDWLREELAGAGKAKAEDRAHAMQGVTARLEEQIRESGLEPLKGVQADAGQEVDFSKARAAADAVLARREFRAVTEEALWERVIARVSAWLGRLFAGSASMGRYAAWMGPALEWGFVLAVCVGAVLWGLRGLRRQRLAIALGAQGAATVREWDEATRKWLEASRAAADAGDWREAVHALYWASVVELDGRRVWRQSRGRTPREYLRLLDGGSPLQAPVRGLTGLLERIWYGLGEARREDYERALAYFDAVRLA